MKKFYKLVSDQEVENGFHILLDGKPVKTPSATPLLAYNQALSSEIVSEWSSQGDDIIPDSMPLTQLLTTAQDQVSQRREDMERSVLAYLDTDLICYRTKEPEDLALAQSECWDVWTAWFEKQYNVSLKTTTDLIALSQDKKAHEKVASEIKGMDDPHFTVLQLITPLCGSLVLGLAFMHGNADNQQVFEAANVEELYKGRIYDEEKYGADPLEEKKRVAMQRDLRAARKFLQLIDI